MTAREDAMANESTAGSGAITFTGLGSGTDFQTMITKLVEVESFHKKQMINWRTDWENKIEGLQQINTAMLDLRTTLQSMDTPSEFLTKQVSSNDEAVLTAVADATAESATHTVQVQQLATNAIIVANTGFSAKNAVVSSAAGSAVFAYSYKGVDVSVTIATGTTLEGMVNSINSDPNNQGVRASLAYDGASYYLQLRGLDLGSNADLSFNAGLTTMSNAAFNGAGDFTTTQLNRDALIKVNGWPTASNAWIQSASNSITTAIPGLTLNLKSLGTSPPTTVTLSVETDLDAVKENVRTFVDQVNALRTVVRELTKFDELQKKGSILTGNYAVQLVDSQLKTAVAGLGKGFLYYEAGPPPTGDKIAALSHVGILTDASEGSTTQGQLILDEARLDEVLKSNPDGVAELFGADYLGGQKVDSGNFSYLSSIDTITKAGAYDVEYTVSGGAITSATIDGVAATINNTDGTITAASGDAKGIVVKINDFPANSTGSGVVRLKQGKAGEISDLLKNLTSDTSGPLNILEDNYTDIIDNIEKKIDYEESRLLRMESDLRNKFARLEALLGQYDQLSQSFQSQSKQLSTS